jgi:hypothetical protein
MLGRVLVLGRVATADMSTGEAKPQVDPAIAELYALFADVFIGGRDLDLVGVFATHSSPALSGISPD